MRAPTRDGDVALGVDAERRREPGAAGVGEVHGAGALGAADPAELEHPARHGGAEAAGEVVALLGPVDAVADQRAPPAGDRVDVHAPRGQLGVAARRQPVVDVAARRRQPVVLRELGVEAPVAALDETAVEQRAHDRDAQPAAEVVVTEAAHADGVRGAALAQRADRPGGRELGERLEQPPDLRPGEPVVAVATVRLDRQQARVDEPAEVARGGRGSDAGLRGEHARGQRAAVAEGQQHARARRVGELRGEGGDVGVSDHADHRSPGTFRRPAKRSAQALSPSSAAR